MSIKKLLDNFITLLKEENSLLTRLDDPEKLLNLLDKKREILYQLSNYSEEELKKYTDKLKEIEILTKKNQVLADNNMKFIDEVFSSLFEESVEKYDSYGNVSKENTSGLFNKKI